MPEDITPPQWRPRTAATRLAIHNGARYPSISIAWREDDSWCGGGWTGELVLWRDANTRDPRTHTVGVGQGCPLGNISFQFDSVVYGAWAFGSFEGTGITERDLQWATAWALLALKSRRAQGDLDPIPPYKPLGTPAPEFRTHPQT